MGQKVLLWTFFLELMVTLRTLIDVSGITYSHRTITFEVNVF